jgi:hypothetical protein
MAIVLATSQLVLPAARGQVSGASDTQGTQMLADLQSLTDANWARVAGTDTNLPPHVNGHDEFLSSWTALALDALHGLPVTVIRQHFTPPGFGGVTPTVPATNVIVTVPGSQHPGDTVVIGCHPDGEPDSHGSAYDDASGCVIALGLARVLGEQWRQHGLPSLTVQFDLFDAEEQGLGGSLAYVFYGRHGALMPRPVFMINEEQSGMGYPVRPFGLVGNDTLPTYAITTPPDPSTAISQGILERIAASVGPVVRPKAADLALAQTRVAAARDAAFSALHAAYSPLAYRDGTRDAFSPADSGKVQITSILDAGSDNQPFEADGLPTATFAGEYAFYTQSPPDWAYPFDQPSDTFTNLACDSGGSPTPSNALAAALDLELSMSLSLVNAYAPSASGQAGLTAFSTQPRLGKKTTFTAVGTGHFSWGFGDGKSASGQTVTHTFKKAGTYRVTLTSGSSHVTWRLKVPKRAATLSWFGPGRVPGVNRWAPAELQSVTGCH